VGATVQMRNIWKYFPGVVANRGIDFELQSGKVHALLGENGAGKSTLMNILAGQYRPDAGSIVIEDVEVSLRSPSHAIACGIGMVHQHFRLVEKLTVAENIHLGWKETPWHVSGKVLQRRTDAICQDLALGHVDCSAKIWQISTGEQQRVEIARVLSRGAKILILDEPTAVLTPNEATELFRSLRGLAATGRTVVLITHKLDEVMAMADVVTVLRGGKHIATKPISECDKRLLARLMIGEDLAFDARYPHIGEAGDAVFELRGVRALNDRGLPALAELNLILRQREILGVAGVAGNGQSELAEVITGLRPLEGGAILLLGKDFSTRGTVEFVKAGVGHIPEDRLGRGLVPSASVTNNAILKEFREPPISSGFKMNNTAAAHFAAELVKAADVRVPSVKTVVHHLSGGNQQKLLSRRETRIASEALVAVHPTRGLDVAATEAVRKAIVDHRNAGAAVLLISEDLDEILLLADRVIVMYRGRILGEFSGEAVNREEIGMLMGGVQHDAHPQKVGV
jgi:ABC-type uncharacterized transport system ATPase subunit